MPSLQRGPAEQILTSGQIDGPFCVLRPSAVLTCVPTRTVFFFYFTSFFCPYTHLALELNIAFGMSSDFIPRRVCPLPSSYIYLLLARAGALSPTTTFRYVFILFLSLVLSFILFLLFQDKITVRVSFNIYSLRQKKKKKKMHTALKENVPPG